MAQPWRFGTTRKIQTHPLNWLWQLSLLAITLQLGCGKDKPTGPDVTPPGGVGALSAVVLGSDTVLLSWTAPGDDANVGLATAYDARHSATPINSENFSQADTLGGAPTPAAPGTVQQLYATALPGGSTQYFAIKTSDERGNWSPIRFLGPVVTALDTIPPGRVKDLHIQGFTDTTVILGWTVTGDDGNRGRVDRYELRYVGGAIRETNWKSAHTADLKVATLGAPGSPASAIASAIVPRVSVTLALRSIDESGNQSYLSNTVAARLTAGPMTWIVRSDGSGTAPTVQAAIDSSERGDTVLVQPGVYHELINFMGKDIQVRSVQGPDATTLDGTGLDGPVVSFAGTETRSSILEGFTITGGSGFQFTPTQRYGGGVYCPSGSPTIRGNIIRNNNLPGRASAGGGIAIGYLSFSVHGNPLIENNLIEDNSVGHAGGGISIVYCSATLRNNTLRRNSCGFDGGGIWGYLLRGGITIEGGEYTENVGGDHGGAIEADGADDGPNSGYSITGGLFLRNRAEGMGVSGRDTGTGGAIAIRGTRGEISHNTFIGNIGVSQVSPCTGGTILLDNPDGSLSTTWNIIVDSQGCGIVCYSAPNAIIENNLLWSNTPSDAGHVGPDCADSLQFRNVFADPRFCGRQSGNYHLSTDSPAVIQGEVIGAYSTLGCSDSERGSILSTRTTKPRISALRWGQR